MRLKSDFSKERSFEYCPFFLKQKSDKSLSFIPVFLTNISVSWLLSRCCSKEWGKGAAGMLFPRLYSCGLLFCMPSMSEKSQNRDVDFFTKLFGWAARFALHKKYLGFWILVTSFEDICNWLDKKAKFCKFLKKVEKIQEKLRKSCQKSKLLRYWKKNQKSFWFFVGFLCKCKVPHGNMIAATTC